MWTVVSIKIDPRMKKAVERLAKQEFSSTAGIFKKAVARYLKENGINWEDEDSEKKPKPKK